jgi:beta-phosphoglucomutase-like phosphatase (HAD superfamily)
MMGRYRAVVFDLDGVLWDGEPLYHEAFNVVLRPLGHTVSQDDYTNIIGHSVEAAWDWVIGHFGLVEPRDEFVRQYDTAVLQMLKAPVEPLPGVRELIKELHRRRIPVGLASASLRQWVDATIRGLGLEDAFGVTVSASEVEHAKPAPDLYLKAAAGLGVGGNRVQRQPTPGIGDLHAGFALCGRGTTERLSWARLLVGSLSGLRPRNGWRCALCLRCPRW